MFVYSSSESLHFGRAIPREWFRDGNEPYAEDVETGFGKVGVRYRPEVSAGKISATVTIADSRSALGATQDAPGAVKTLVRLRHPEKLPIKSVTVNGAGHAAFDADKGDVDVTGLKGKLEVVVNY
jgi:hypothetical protein